MAKGLAAEFYLFLFIFFFKSESIPVAAGFLWRFPLVLCFMRNPIYTDSADRSSHWASNTTEYMNIVRATYCRRCFFFF